MNWANIDGKNIRDSDYSCARDIIKRLSKVSSLFEKSEPRQPPHQITKIRHEVELSNERIRAVERR